MASLTLRAMLDLISQSTLIFDLDGTVADTMDLHRESWRRFGALHGFAADDPEILASSRGRTTPESMRVLFAGGLSEQALREQLDVKQDLFWQAAQDRLAPIAGFEVFAAWLQTQAVRRALGTAGESHNVGRILDALQLQDFFEVRVTGDMGLPGKPNPDIFLRGAAQLGVAPETCIVLEDAVAGVEAARRAGMRCIAVCSDHTAEELAGPHVIAAIHDYRELLGGVTP
jgi:beta-phosphoglucomutase-like phosphatase (HAD superfamily)